jgi:hypothetical protein
LCVIYRRIYSVMYFTNVWAPYHPFVSMKHRSKLEHSGVLTKCNS